MRACFFVAAFAIVACLPARAEPPSAPVTVGTPRVELEPTPSAARTVASTIIGRRGQGTVSDRQEDDEVWSEGPDASDQDEVATTCKNCPQAEPARRVTLPAPPITAPRN